METDSRKIVDNILSDMAELNDWICMKRPGFSSYLS